MRLIVLDIRLGYGTEAAFFFALALIEDRIMAVIFLTLGVGISGIAISGERM